MDVNTMRSLVTLAGLVLFLALVVWTWSRSRKAAFDEAAQLPFQDAAEEEGSLK